MTIMELLEGLSIRKKGSLDREIKGIAYDSRLVQEDYLFVAIRGYSVDGHDFIHDALSRGAASIVSERAVEKVYAEHSGQHSTATYIQVSDSRDALALISAAYYRHPAQHLSLAGITGTNGKTTTSYITKSILESGGTRSGLLGTICYMVGDKTVPALNTTPESLDLHRYLSEMIAEKIKYAVIEVSSHALTLKRVNGCTFAVVAFTNFTQDHLDFHGSMDEYFEAKCRIFSYLEEGGTAVLNYDDPMIRPLADTLSCNVMTYGIAEGAEVKAENIVNRMAKSKDRRHDVPAGLSFDVVTPGKRFAVNSRLLGRFNVYNILASISIAAALGMSEKTIQEGVAAAKPVPGRFENIDEGQEFFCIVDYAHTEDALRKLIAEARHVTPGRVLTVFGCGGNRDILKRPLMGAAASEMSDIAVITSDNPRNEDPADIIEEIIRGIHKDNYTVYLDREEAIRAAVAMADEGDSVLVAGKGHENYQEIGGERYHFSDREILRKAIMERLTTGTQGSA